jgi:hypothetical protein
MILSMHDIMPWNPPPSSRIDLQDPGSNYCGRQAAAHAALESGKSAEGWFVPDVSFINVILTKYNIGYEIQPPDLVIRALVASSEDCSP